MTTLSTHILDTERGAPAQGVSVALFQGDRLIARAETNAAGRIPDLAPGDSWVGPGVYRLVFDLAPYFESRGRAEPFLRQVALEFQLAADQPHYHVPLLLSPYALTTYRGS